MKSQPSVATALKILIGLPLLLFAALTVVQLPKLWRLTGGDPRIILLCVLQGGLPVMPFILYGLSLLAAADMVRRLSPTEPVEPSLIRGLNLTGAGLIGGAVTLWVAHSDWVWRYVYNNDGPQALGVFKYTLFAAVSMLLGLILMLTARRIRTLQAQRLALKAELEQYV